MSGAHEQFYEFSALVRDEPLVGTEPDGVTGWLRRLCATAARVLPATGAGVSVMTDQGVRSVAAASDDRSEQLEELQFVFGEGPCLEAFSSRRPVLEPAMVRGGVHRWAAYGPAAAARGVRAVFAFPLQVGAARLGVMDVYREHEGQLSAGALSSALVFADVAVNVLLYGQENAPTGEFPTGLDDALANRFEVYQAQGMAMVDLGVGLDEAMARLRAHAFAEDRSLSEVAQDIVAGRLRLESDHS